MRLLYRYVGPKQIAERALRMPLGIQVLSRQDVLDWASRVGPDNNAATSFTATFVVDESGCLRIADRRSEHVACASGRPVQSAGEMTFAKRNEDVTVEWVTNQSTGYCPEPDSWPAVRSALDRAGIEAPDGFTQEFVFRRCTRCGSINIVKDGVFECGVCSSALPPEWNLDAEITVTLR